MLLVTWLRKIDHNGQSNGHVQSGFSFVGLATTKPKATPTAFDPADPMLFRMPCRAIGLSEAMKSSSDVVARF